MAYSNYQIRAGTVFEAFDSLTGFTSSGTTGGTEATELDTTSGHFTEGTSGIRLVTSGGASSNRYITKTISKIFSTEGVMSVDLYVPDTTKISGITIYLSEDSGFTNYNSKSFAASALRNGINRLVIGRDGWGATGTPTWATEKIRMRFRVDAATNQVGDVTFDNFIIGRYNRPKVIFRFDDNRLTQYTVAYPIMKALGLKASVFVISSTVGASTYMTQAQMDELHEQGWDMCMHTNTHTDLSTQTLAEQIAEIQTCQAYLMSKGYTRREEHRHLVFPFGGYDNNTLAMITSSGLLSGGTIISPRSTITPIDNTQLLTIDNISQTVTLASAKSRIDRAIAEGGATTLLFHQFAEPSVASTEWDTSDFLELCQYIKMKEAQIDCVTWTEYWQGIANGRKKI